MKTLDVLTLIALLLGPVSSVLIAQAVQQRMFRRAQRLNVFTSLLATRGDRMCGEHLRALALIDVVYVRFSRVRKKWADYFEALSNPGYNNANGTVTRGTKFNDLLSEMAHTLGYGREIGFEEIARVYTPQGVVDSNDAQRESSQELLRVLKASENFGEQRRSDVTRLPPR